MKKWLKEPLLHFLVIGALIFIVFSMVNTQEISVDEKKIVVSTGDIERQAAILVEKPEPVAHRD